MANPKHKIFFGGWVDPEFQANTERNDVIAPGFPPPDQPPVEPDDMTPPGWTWDSEVVKLSSENRTMDEGYTTEQLIYILSQ
jgi:hypothetical protein